MRKRKPFSLFLLAVCVLLMLSACSSSPSTKSQPNWVRDPYTKYDKQAIVAAVGSASDRQAAEKSALGNLVGIFGQSIQVDEKVSVSYREAVEKGVAATWSENTSVDNTISTTAGLDTLVGAEIGDTWFDGKTTHYAVAVLEKSKARMVYSEMIRSNQAMINDLVNLPESQKNSFDGYARYQFAATVADINVTYGNLLSFIGAPPQNLKKGDDYRLEAANITKAIPVAMRVQNDKSGRIQGAFTKALSDLGFRTGGTNSRYVLTVNVVSSPVEIANNPNKWARIEVTANLTDTSSGTVVVPYTFNNREGHTSQSEADNRVILAAERRINQEYSQVVNNYLSQLLPKK